MLYHIQSQYLLVRKAVNTAHWLKLPKIILFSPIFQLTSKCLNVKQDLQTAPCSLGCLAPLSLQPRLTNPIWLRLRNSANQNRRKQKCKRKVRCLPRNDRNGETNRQVSPSEVCGPYTLYVPQASSSHLTSFSHLTLLSCKDAGSDLNDCSAPFHINESRTTNKEDLSLPGSSGRQGRRSAH